jgi:hypothetical protein
MIPIIIDNLVEYIEKWTEPLMLFACSIGFVGLFMIDSKNKYSFFPGSTVHSRVIETSFIKYPEYKKEFAKINAWTEQETVQSENKTNTTYLSKHWWYHNLPLDIKKSIDKCVLNTVIDAMFRTLFYEKEYNFMLIPDMNELYIAGTDQQDVIHSDRVFFIPHIDGPFSWIPYLSVYRTLIALNPNEHIQTCFPIAEKEIILSTGDVLAFDFNREIHYINEISTSKKPRTVLKSHYCIYPKGWNIYARLALWMNASYNELFRILFLTSIHPVTIFESLCSYAVVYGTNTFVWSDMFIGHKNILYVCILCYLCKREFLSIESIHNVLFATLLYKQYAIYMFVDNISDIEPFTHIRDLLLYGVFNLGYFPLRILYGGV